MPIYFGYFLDLAKYPSMSFPIRAVNTDDMIVIVAGDILSCFFVMYLFFFHPCGWGFYVCPDNAVYIAGRPRYRLPTYVNLSQGFFVPSFVMYLFVYKSRKALILLSTFGLANFMPSSNPARATFNNGMSRLGISPSTAGILGNISAINFMVSPASAAIIRFS